MFSDALRSGHEPDDSSMIDRILKIAQGEVSYSEIRSHLRRRDRRLCLDIDSSQLNFFVLEHLLQEFSDAKFLLTIRDCYSWLDSFINDSLRRCTSEEWIKFREFRFRANKFTHPLQETALKRRGLYTLDGYLSYWANHNQKVINTVPSNRLMIVKTNEITEKAYEIAAFAGLQNSTVQLSRSHSFKNSKKFYVLGEIEQNYLQSKVREHCQDLMCKVFPEIQSLEDANL
jgi:hypothetical protein